MNTIVQTVNIQPNRQISLQFDAPADYPLGLTDVFISLKPRQQTSDKKLLDPAERRKKLMAFAGALADSDALGGDAVEIQRKMRSEWDEMANANDSLHFANISEWPNEHIEVTEELIKQRREVLESRTHIQRAEWGQGNIDEWLRKERDEDRF